MGGGAFGGPYGLGACSFEFWVDVHNLLSSEFNVLLNVREFTSCLFPPSFLVLGFDFNVSLNNRCRHLYTLQDETWNLVLFGHIYFILTLTYSTVGLQISGFGFWCETVLTSLLLLLFQVSPCMHRNAYMFQVLCCCFCSWFQVPLYYCYCYKFRHGLGRKIAACCKQWTL